MGRPRALVSRRQRGAFAGRLSQGRLPHQPLLLCIPPPRPCCSDVCDLVCSGGSEGAGGCPPINAGVLVLVNPVFRLPEPRNEIWPKWEGEMRATGSCCSTGCLQLD